ncbi:hypothetical protein D3C79_693790 [compost metagenome]
MVQRMPAGAAISRSLRFMANTLIASSSADSRMRPISSVSIWSDSLIFQVQLTTPCSHLSAGRFCRLSLRWWAMIPSQGLALSSSPVTSARLRIPSLRPRSMASTRWEGALCNGSSCSK